MSLSRPGGRPRRSRDRSLARIVTRVTAAERRVIERTARAESVTVAELIRWAVADFIDEREGVSSDKTEHRAVG